MDSEEGVKFELKQDMHEDVRTLKYSKVGKHPGADKLIMDGIKNFKSNVEIVKELQKEFPDAKWAAYDVSSFLSLNSKLMLNLAKLDKKVATQQSKLHMEIQGHYDKIMKEAWALFSDSKYDGKNKTALDALKLLSGTMAEREKTLGRFKYGDKNTFINIQNQISDTTKDIQKKLAQAKFKQIPNSNVEVEDKQGDIVDVGTEPMEEDED